MRLLEITTFPVSSRLQEMPSVLPPMLPLPCKDKLIYILILFMLFHLLLILTQIFSTFLLSVPSITSLVFPKAHSFACILRVRLIDHTFLHTSPAPLSISDAFTLCSLTSHRIFICPHFHDLHFCVSLYLHGSCVVIKTPSRYSNGNQRPCLLKAKINGQFVATVQCKALLLAEQFYASFQDLIEVFAI